MSIWTPLKIARDWVISFWKKEIPELAALAKSITSDEIMAIRPLILQAALDLFQGKVSTVIDEAVIIAKTARDVAIVDIRNAIGTRLRHLQAGGK